MKRRIINIGKWTLITIICSIYLGFLVVFGRYMTMNEEMNEVKIGEQVSEEMKAIGTKSEELLRTYYLSNGINSVGDIKGIFKDKLDYIETIALVDEKGLDKKLIGDLNLSYIYKSLDSVYKNEDKNKKVVFISNSESNDKFYLAVFYGKDGMKHFKMSVVGVNLLKFKEKVLAGKIKDEYNLRLSYNQKFIVGDLLTVIDGADYEKNISFSDNNYLLEFEKSQESLDKNKNKILIIGIVSLLVFGVVTVLIVLLIDNNVEKLSEEDKVTSEDDDIAETIQEKYKLVIEGANDVMWMYDVKNRHIEISHKFSEIVEVDEKLVYTRVYSIMEQVIYEDDLQVVMNACNTAIEGLTTYVQNEFRMKIKGGKIHWFLLRGRTLKDENGDVISMAGSLTDINEYKLNENKIRYLAYYDTLTGIPNIKSFSEKFEEYFYKDNNDIGAIIFCDIDDLKRINNVMGHIMGDHIIKETAYKLMNFVSVMGTICRISGDQFGMLIYDIKNKAELEEMCKSIIAIFNEDLYINGNNITSSVSVGATLYGEHGKSFEELSRHVDMALSKAKENGKNSYVIFDKSLEEENLIKSNMEKALKQDLRDRRLEFYYQPKMNIKDKTICGFEALMRWHHNAVWISPLEFIRLAEEKGIIDMVGNYVLEEVCKQIEIWNSCNVDFKSVAVNISPIHLKKNEFICKLKRIMEMHSIKPGELQIEITESPFSDDINELKEKIQTIVDMGIEISLGNFGTGYSSLECFLNMPINGVKIDKSILLGENRMINNGVIETITQLCHKIGLKVVAEGVETEEQLKTLERFNCDLAQGYYIAKPMSVCSVPKYIKDYEETTMNRLLS